VNEYKVINRLYLMRKTLMASPQTRRAIGTFPTRREAEQVLTELRDSGFPMDKVSVVAKDSDRTDDIAGADMSNRVGNKADEGATKGAVSGGAVGGLTGLLVGLGMLAIPGIGPVMMAGAGATALATALSGTAIGAAAGGLLGGLVGLGIPEADAKVYNDRVSRGDYLVMVEGTQAEVDQADLILNGRGIADWNVYNSTAGAAVDNVVPLTPNPVRTREAVNAEETIRRKELDVTTQGRPVVDSNLPR
jgi:hypothetical protein